MKMVIVGCEIPGSSEPRFVAEFEAPTIADGGAFLQASAEVLRQSRVRAAVNVLLRALYLGARASTAREDVTRLLDALQQEVSARTCASDWIGPETGAEFLETAFRRAPSIDPTLVQWVRNSKWVRAKIALSQPAQALA